MSEKAFRVLIADDAPINRMILSSLLAPFGAEADEAENGNECIELCKTHTYDMIFLDQRMPELDGTDTLAQLTEIFRQNGQNTPVICHTAENAPEQTAILKAAGFTDVLGKPATPEQLAALLGTYFSDGIVTDTQSPQETADRTETELTLLPKWLSEYPELNLRSAIEHCGTARRYMDALSVFAESISQNTAELEQLLAEKNLKQYALRAHSLKSVARLIGADTLSDLAAGLETAGDKNDTERLAQDAPVLLEKYRAFASLADRLSETPDRSGPSAARHVRNALLFISGDDGFIPNAIVNKLKTANFDVICVPDNMDAISQHQDQAEILLYYLPKTIEQALRTTQNLLPICHDEHKTLCVAGEPFPVEKLRAQEYSDQIHAFYQRPMDIDILVSDMKKLSASHDEFYRQKTIVLVDDDPAFIKIVSQWLADDYALIPLHSGQEVLTYLERSRPDLILLDYEMPGLDGYQVLGQIRENPMTAQVPVIFLTGHNERDRVIHILAQRPDGYLLKTASRDDLLATLKRFFVNTILKPGN